MTSGWVHRRAYLECDGPRCSESIEGEGPSITDLWNDAKAQNWKAEFKYGEWFHYCPNCHPKDPTGNISRILEGS